VRRGKKKKTNPGKAVRKDLPQAGLLFPEGRRWIVTTKDTAEVGRAVEGGRGGTQIGE